MAVPLVSVRASVPKKRETPPESWTRFCRTRCFVAEELEVVLLARAIGAEPRGVKPG